MPEGGWLEQILAKQLTSGLTGLAGSEATATIRLSDQLLNEIIANALPEGGAVRTLTLHARGGNAIDVTVGLNTRFLPALHPHLTIERQPSLPDDAVLTLRLQGGAAALAGPASRFLGGSLPLPSGVRLEGDVVLINLRVLLESRQLAVYLGYVRELRVTTEESAVVINVAAAVNPSHTV